MGGPRFKTSEASGRPTSRLLVDATKVMRLCFAAILPEVGEDVFLFFLF